MAPFRHSPVRNTINFNLLLRPLVAVVILTVLFRYLQTPEDSPEIQDLQPHSKAVVLLSPSADSADSAHRWLSLLPTDWQVRHYVPSDEIASSAPVSNANSLHDLIPVPTRRKRAAEFMAFLSYIIANYNDLPDVTLFWGAPSPGSPEAAEEPNRRSGGNGDSNSNRKNDATTASKVAQLQARHVVTRGFLPATCPTACPTPLEIPDLVVDHGVLAYHGLGVQLRTVLGRFTPSTEAVPTRLAAPGGMRFVASREAIRARGISWWRMVRSWLEDLPTDEMQTGRLMEWTWQVWLGRQGER